ncbi:MAG: DNA-processing protein DprA [Patescibacteria group bacterium]
MLDEYPISKLDKESWPQDLMEIPQPPEEMYIRGEMPDDTYIKLCVVGARKYTQYGKEVTRKLILGLRGHPVCIVSGLAMGIDSIAHEAAIDAGLPTITVPGSGLDVSAIHPKVNISLAREILRHGGCMLSEFPPDLKANYWTFPQRNRIMAALCKATLIIEAERKSGTLITARLATEYNKDVFTVPGSIFSATSTGPLLLMRLGATPIGSPEDLLEALGIETSSENKQQMLFEDMTEDEKMVCKNIAAPLSRDELTIALKWPSPRLNMALTLLELKGAIKESGGKVYLT